MPIPYAFSGYDILKEPVYSTYLSYFVQGFFSMGVPLFFMVNGALLLNKPYYLKKHLFKTGVIALLMLVWAAITLLLTEPLYNKDYTFAEIVRYSWTLERNEVGHLWFLHALVYIYLLFPLIKALYDSPKKEHTVYLVTLIFIFTFGNVALENALHVGSYLLGTERYLQKEFNLGGSINPFPSYFSYSFVYFLIGGIMVKGQGNYSVKASHLYLVLLVASLVLFLLGVVKTKTSGSLYDTTWNGYDTVMTLAMSVAVFLLCSKISLSSKKLNNLLHLIGINTLGIYFIHVPVGEWLTRYYEATYWSSFLAVDLLYGLFLLFISLSITLILRRIPAVNKLVKL